MARGVVTKTQYFPFGGGLDIVSPALALNPGALLAVVNFEPWFSGGYRRIDGYERYDGRAAPSAAVFYGFSVSSTTGLTVNAAITDSTSGATGNVIGIDATNGIIGVTNIVGTFNKNDALTWSGGSGSITSTPESGFVFQDNVTTYLSWLAAAQAYYRSQITQVPGSGSVTTGHQRGSVVFAIRPNVGATAGILFKATSTGWTTSGITMTSTMYFNTGGGGAGRALPVPGNTITGHTSGATATVHYTIIHSGAPATNDAAGYFVVTNVVGTFQNGEQIWLSGAEVAVAATVCTAFALPVGGNYQWLDWNFFGSSASFYSYVVNGLGPAFEIDNNLVVSPILFPLSPVTNQPVSNTPIFVEQHLGYLMLASPGGIFYASVVGQPLIFNGFLGAAEFGLGAEITGMASVVGPALIITTNRNTQALTGASPADWQLGLIGERMGAQAYTAQKFDSFYTFNSIGITKFTRTLSFGNFAGAVVSQLIQPIVQQYLNLATSSRIVSLYNQYRVYMNDGTFLIMFIPQAGQANMPGVSVAQASNVMAFGLAQYPIAVANMSVGIDSNGQEQGFFATSTNNGGNENGYLYHDLSGTSFDGNTVNSYIRLAFNHVGTPSYRKFFRRADLEVQATLQTLLSFVADLTYGSSQISSLVEQITVANAPVIDIFGGGGFWDVSNWDQFTWDGQNISTARAELSGTGENVSFLIFNQGIAAPSFVLQGLTLHFELRRLQR